MKEKKKGSIIEFILVAVLTALVVAVLGVLFGTKKTVCPVEEKAAAAAEAATAPSACEKAPEEKGVNVPTEAVAK